MSGPVTEDPEPINVDTTGPREEPIGVPAEVPPDLAALAGLLSEWRNAEPSNAYELSRRWPALHARLVALDGAYHD